MASIDDVKAALKDKPELVEAVVVAIETEKQRGITESNKSNAEAQNLRKFKIAFEKLGFNKDEHTIDDFVEGISKTKDEIKKSKETKTTLETLTQDFQSLRTNYEKTASELATERKLAGELKEKTKRSKIKEVLTPKLANLFGPDLIIDSFLANKQVDLTDDEQVIFIKGDAKIDLEAGLKAFIEARPDLVKTNMKPGADSAANTTTNTNQDADGKRLQELRKMNRPIY